MKSNSYNASVYNLDEDFYKKIHSLTPWKAIVALAGVWISTYVLVYAVRFYVYPQTWFWWAYFPIVILIAGRMGAFLQMIHEGAHGLIHPNKKTNDAIGAWLCAFPIGVNFLGYSSGHSFHHGYTNTDRDPKSDTSKYKICNFRNPKIYFLFLQDLLGISALNVFLAYKNDKTNTSSHDSPEAPFNWQLLAKLCIVQSFILITLFQFDVVQYILLWLFPAMSGHMFLMRIRGIAEHGLSIQKGIKVQHQDEGTFHTRSFLTPRMNYSFFPPLNFLEKILIGSLNAGFHHEHHLYPKVPFYNLPVLHKRISATAQSLNPDAYTRGYFSAAIWNLVTSTDTLKYSHLNEFVQGKMQTSNSGSEQTV